MKQSSRFVSPLRMRFIRPSLLPFAGLLLLLSVCTACSRHTVAEQRKPLPAILRTDSQSQKYNIQLDFMKHHFSGMLIVRSMPDNEIRILAATYFGLSLFDFSLQGETFKVNSCVEPMRKEKILRLLETDFKNLFLNVKTLRVKEKSSTFEKRTGGRGFGKSVFTLSEYTDGQPERVKIRHPWIRLTIQLDKLNDNKP